MSDSYKQSDKEDRGALFPNEKKERDTQPDLTGKLNVGGVQFYVSAWKNQAKSSGVKYLSLAVTKVDGASSNSATGSDPFP